MAQKGGIIVMGFALVVGLLGLAGAAGASPKKPQPLPPPLPPPPPPPAPTPPAPRPPAPTEPKCTPEQLGALRARLEGVNQEAAGYQREIGGINAAIASLSADRSQLAQRIAAMPADQVDSSGILDDLNRLDNQIHGLRGQEARARGLLQGLAVERTGLEQDIAKCGAP